MTQLTASRRRGDAWFQQGCEAFRRSFPDIAKNIPADRFYVCPVCLKAFSEEALTARVLTREHVPPRSVGGKRMVLTCEECNSKAGHSADSDLRREADIYDFATGNLPETKLALKTKSGHVPVRMSVAPSGIQMFGVPNATHPATHLAVMADFEDASKPDGWQDFKFSVEFRAFSAKRAAASWLRAAYLAFFSALGYRFVFRPELDVVRHRIKHPDHPEPATFRIVRPEVSHQPMLVRVEGPDVFRSYAMVYGRHVVFLPRYNDRELYDRLARQPDTNAMFNGIEYPWPSKGPTFFHDHAPIVRSSPK
jgi:hypothetical protein